MSDSFPSAVRVALIGGGAHGLRSVLGAVASLPGWRVDTIVDPDAAARTQAAALLPGVRTADSVDALGSAVTATTASDLVVVATPPAVTPTVVRALLDLPAFARAALLVEKPGARHADELASLLPACEEHGAPVRIAYSYRRHFTVTAFRAALPQLGPLSSLSLEFHAPFAVTGWRSRVEAGGGALRDLGVHLLDLVRLLVPAPLTLHDAQFQSHTTEHDEVRLSYRAGETTVNIHVSYRGTPTFALTAVGARGRVNSDLWRQTTPSTGRLGAVWARGLTVAMPSRRPAMLLRQSYADAMRFAHTEGATLRDAIAVLQHVHDAEQQARS